MYSISGGYKESVARAGMEIDKEETMCLYVINNIVAPNPGRV